MSSQGPLPTLLKKESKPTLKSLVGRYLAFLLVVVLLGLAMHRFFGWVAFEKPDPQVLFLRVADGRAEMRRAAAVEWVRQLQEADMRTNAELLAALRPTTEQLRHISPDFIRSAECQGKDPLLMSSLAALLGYSDDAEEARKTLKAFLEALPADLCVEARVMALASLVRLGADAQDWPLMLASSEHADPSVRKIAAFGLGRMKMGPEEQKNAALRLKALLQDPVEDVRWNAAIALATVSPADAIGTLKPLLVRAETQSSLSPYELELYREVLRASLLTRDPSLREQVERISMKHPHLKLRQSAKEFLKKNE